MRPGATVALLVLAVGCGSPREQAEEAFAFRVTVSRPAGVQCAEGGVPSLEDQTAALVAAGYDVRDPRTAQVATGGECGDPTATWYAFEARADDVASLGELGWFVGEPGAASAVITGPESPPPLDVASGGATATALPGDACWLVGGTSTCTEGAPPTRATLPVLPLAGDITVDFGALAGTVELGVVPIGSGEEVPDVIPLPATTTIVPLGAPAPVDLEPGEYVLLVQAEVEQGEAQGAVLLQVDA